MAAWLIYGRYSRFCVGGWNSHVLSNTRYFHNKTVITPSISRHLMHKGASTAIFTSCNTKAVTLTRLFYREVVKRSFNSSSNTQRKVLSSQTALNLPSVRQIEQYLASKDIPYEHGHTSIVVGCLGCEEEGKTAKKSMYINKTTGSYLCKNCGRSGSWRQFKSINSEKDGDKQASSLQGQELNQPRTTINSDSDKKANDIWKSSQPVQSASNDVRNRILDIFNIEKISDDSLSKYQVRIVEYQFSEPSGHSSHHPCIVFPWFDSSRTAVHGVKLIRVEEVTTETVALQPRLGTLGLFGWNSVPAEAKEVVLTLNEFDAIAVSQETSYPAISLPLGTHSLPPEVLPQMEQFERIILWFGNDVRARQAANQFSKKLNIQRCHIVRPSGDNPPNGPLDALNKGIDLKELIASSKPISHEKIATFQELRNDVYSELVNADQVSGVKWSRFPKLNTLLKGHRRGELTIFTGPTGAGKTTLLSEMSVDLCQQGVNTLWGSFEIRNVRLAKIMMNQFSGVELQKNAQQFNYWADKFEMLPMYFMCFYGSQNISTVIETMAHAVYVFDIDHVIIDNLQFMTSGIRSEDRFSIQNHAISCLRDFASSKNVHVTLVIHPRKENDDVELQTASIFGTAKASQEADNVLILQDKKGRGEKYLQVTKNRFDGSVGRVPLEFVKDSLSMCGFGKKDNKLQKTFKGSKVVSDVDMINIPSTLPLQKARVRTYSPGNAVSGSGITEDDKMKISNFYNNKMEGVKKFQENVSESIRSQSLRQKPPLAWSGKVNSDPQKLDAKRLYSKTVASLVAKHVNRNSVQTKKMASSQGKQKPAIKSKK